MMPLAENENKLRIKFEEKIYNFHTSQLFEQISLHAIAPSDSEYVLSAASVTSWSELVITSSIVTMVTMRFYVSYWKFWNIYFLLGQFNKQAHVISVKM